MASFHKSLYVFLTFFFALLSFSNAYTFNIGGKDGWTLNPSVNYNEFSSRSRFIVNDTLHFKYNAGSDSVLEVSKSDYDSCTTNNPITTLTGGDSSFNLIRSGPFYFISGNKSHCDQGQKLEVVVISPKTRPSHPAAPPPAGVSPSPVSSPPVSGTPSSPTTSPVSSPPEPGTSPMGSPVSSPPEPGTSPMGSPVSSPPESGTGPTASPFSSPPESGLSPADSPGVGISASPTGNPADENGSSPRGSPSSLSARLQVSVTFTVSLVVMIFGLGVVY